MNILITGATGFIGGAVLRRLIKGRNRIYVFIRDKNKYESLVNEVVYEGDVRNYRSIEYAFQNIDVVINAAAAIPHDKLPNKDYWDINVKGTKNIIKACLKNKVKRLIHISTVGIYGSETDKIVSEKSIVNPEGVYARSKLESEKVIKKSKFANATVILRPTIAYGPGDVRPVFLRLFKIIKRGLNLSIGDGDNYLHTIYIDNLVNVIDRSVYNRKMLGQDFIVGDLSCPHFNDITSKIIKLTNKKCLNIKIPKTIALFLGKLLGVEKTVKFMSDNKRYNVNKIRKYLNLKSDVNLSTGLKRTYNWYIKNKLI